MNKLEQLHFDNHDYRDAAEITEQVAIEFSDWLDDKLTQVEYHHWLQKPTKELFQEFLKTKQ